VIQHVGEIARLAFGELDGQKTARQEALLSACTAAGIGADATDRIDDRIWRKFALLAPLAGATCLGRCPVGGVRDDPGLSAKLGAMVGEVVGEVVALGRARGVTLPQDTRPARFLRRPPAETLAGQARSWRAVRRPAHRIKINRSRPQL
jgi:2-dehydropantoate 2-reductase